MRSRSSTRTPIRSAEIDREASFSTYLFTTLPYFLTRGDREDDQGEDEDDDRHPLAPVLEGARSVACDRLENGAFFVVPETDVGVLSGLLAGVDRTALRDAVLGADLEDILDGEVWEELEQLNLSEPEEVAKGVLSDLEGLTELYAAAAREGRAIVLYTT